jgi:hypothetical protein
MHLVAPIACFYLNSWSPFFSRGLLCFSGAIGGIMGALFIGRIIKSVETVAAADHRFRRMSEAPARLVHRARRFCLGVGL